MKLFQNQKLPLFLRNIRAENTETNSELKTLHFTYNSKPLTNKKYGIFRFSKTL